MVGYTRKLKKLLRESGCEFHSQGRGDHEIWWNPTAGKKFDAADERRTAPLKKGDKKPVVETFRDGKTPRQAGGMCRQVRAYAGKAIGLP